MPATKKLTVSALWLTHEANRIEESAKGNLRTLIILGNEQQYLDDMARVDALRRAVSIRNIGERRHFLRSNGIEA